MKVSPKVAIDLSCRSHRKQLRRHHFSHGWYHLNGVQIKRDHSRSHRPTQDGFGRGKSPPCPPETTIRRRQERQRKEKPTWKVITHRATPASLPRYVFSYCCLNLSLGIFHIFLPKMKELSKYQCLFIQFIKYIAARVKLIKSEIPAQKKYLNY
jgi:hypothetical protein